MQGPTPPVKPTPPTPPAIGGKENAEAKPVAPAQKSESGSEKKALPPPKEQPVKAVQEKPGAPQKDNVTERPVKNFPQSNYQAETGAKTEQPSDLASPSKATSSAGFGGMLTTLLLAVSLVSIIAYRFFFAGKLRKKAVDLPQPDKEKKPGGKTAADEALKMIAALQNAKQAVKETAAPEVGDSLRTQTGEDKAKQSGSTFDFRV